jgi:hypothetical protein
MMIAAMTEAALVFDGWSAMAVIAFSTLSPPP